MFRALLPASALLVVVAAAPAVMPRPGRWEVTIKPNAIPIPKTLEQESGETLRAIMTRPYFDRVCLKRTDAAIPLALLAFKGEKSCTATRADLKDGALSGEATCTESNRPMTATIAGAYTASTLDYTVIRVEGGLDKPGTPALTVTATRKGAC